MNLAVTKRGIAAFCGVATTVTLCAVLAVFITSVRKPRGSTQYVITSPTKHPTFSPTDSLMPSISIEPSSRPSATPTFSPSSKPSLQPTPWPSLAPSSSTMPTDSPSFEPSSFPSEYPTNLPSQNPTMSASPSSQPSSRPTLSAAPSSWPSLAPSSSRMPTNFPSSEPSSFPSEYPSAKSSFKPSTNPSFSPSNEPTSIPSAVQPRTKTIVITGESGGNMLAMGAVCLILVASTAFYLRRRQNNSNFSNLQCPSDQNDKYPQYGSDAVAPNKPDSVDGAGTLKRSTKNEKNTKVDDVDLEDGRGGTNSVYNKLMAGNINIMAQAIHVPKLLTRQKEKKADDKQSVADSVEVTPKASKPVRVISRLSPMFSPMREFSIKMNEKKRRSLTANYQKSRSMACLGSPPMMQGRSCDSDSADDDEQEQVKKMNGIEESYETKLTNHQRVDAKASSSRHLAGSDSAASCPEPADVSMGGLLQFTYEEELLNSSRADGGFSFRDVYFDPENELYECHVPSGPLGISVGATQLGLRVQNLNPTSPLCKIVSIGDVIVGVDDVDVVGVESSVFWQLVSRRANKNGCCLVILKI